MAPVLGNFPAMDFVTTAGVTLLGFIGAIAALRVQAATLSLRTAQHKHTAEEKSEKQEIEDAKKPQLKREEKWRCARAVSLSISARRGLQADGQHFVDKPPLTVTCELKVPRVPSHWSCHGYSGSPRRISGYSKNLQRMWVARKPHVASGGRHRDRIGPRLLGLKKTRRHGYEATPQLLLKIPMHFVET